MNNEEEPRKNSTVSLADCTILQDKETGGGMCFEEGEVSFILDKQGFQLLKRSRTISRTKVRVNFSPQVFFGRRQHNTVSHFLKNVFIINIKIS